MMTWQKRHLMMGFADVTEINRCFYALLLWNFLSRGMLILQLVLYSTKQHFSPVCANAVIWHSDSNYIGKVFIRLIRANKFRLEM